MAASDASDYKSSGVDIDAADSWVERISARVTARSSAELAKRLVTGVGDYASVYALSDQQWVATSCDGVGTKLLWTAAGLGRPEDLAQDLVAMNANDVLCVGARPTLFLDYLAVGSRRLLEEGATLARFIDGLVQVCAESGQLLVGGETAQMPDLYPDGGFDMAGFSVGFMSPSERLGVERVRPGAEVWGWASNGPHSNGFSLLRKLFDTKADADFIREHLMGATKLYVRPFDELRRALGEAGREALQAAYHITGSGLLNLLRAQPAGRQIGFDLSEWPSEDPLWIQVLARRSGLGAKQLFSTFNMGWGFLVVLDPAFSQSRRSLLQSLELKPLGRVISEPEVRVRGVVLR